MVSTESGRPKRFWVSGVLATLLAGAWGVVLTAAQSLACLDDTGEPLPAGTFHHWWCNSASDAAAWAIAAPMALVPMLVVAAGVRHARQNQSWIRLLAWFGVALATPIAAFYLIDALW